MSKFLVAGLINLETTVRIDGFPLDYKPNNFTFFGVQSRVSGVGYNLAKALTTLGNTVHFASLIANDPVSELIISALDSEGISSHYCQRILQQSAQSAVLYDPDGRRQIFTDLKDIQEQSYPVDQLRGVFPECDLAVICNINFARPMLPIARALGIPIATDLHTISDLEDPYNKEFMDADILFMSHERLPCKPEEWARRMLDQHLNQILVIGLGADGALLAAPSQGFFGRLPAQTTRPVVNTIGAGDALFSSFLHGYSAGLSAYQALQQAILFASYKIGEVGAAQGFLSAAELSALYAKHHQSIKI